MTKKRIDITHVIMAAHEDFITDEISLEVEKELKDGLPDELRQRVLTVMELAKASKSPATNISPIDKKSKNQQTALFVPLFGEFELRAAASDEEKNELKWFETIGIIAGYEIEISLRGENTTEVLVTILKKDGTALDKHAGKDIKIVINKNNCTLLSANLYVFPDANIAKGDGIVLEDVIKTYSSKDKWTIDSVIE